MVVFSTSMVGWVGVRSMFAPCSQVTQGMEKGDVEGGRGGGRGGQSPRCVSHMDEAGVRGREMS
jgi:hypothetical protein